ncbi:MAG: DUF2804 domain-containing protein [Myxococcales bacterium]|nr:DUF2804 domain-containing protein [Myxococcales bacterium]
MGAVTPVLPAVPPTIFDASGAIADGVYRGTIADANLKASRWPLSWRQKEWHYLSAVTDRHLVAVAVVQLGYLANSFAYVVELTGPSDHQPWQFEGLSPLGTAVRFGQGPARGVTSWRSSGAAIDLRTDDDGYTARIDLPVGRGTETKRLCARLECKRGEALTLVHTLPTGRPACTEKVAGLPASLDMLLGEHDIGGAALASSDWTRSVAMRQTVWKWASLSGTLPDGRHLGLNLSAQVYDDSHGQSRENALWIDGKVHALAGGVLFSVPQAADRQPWLLSSQQGDAVLLRFEPLGARRQDIDYWLVVSRFVQPYGRFYGHLRVDGQTLAIDGMVGVVEEHLAKW